jgi:hypothetical protein
MPTASINVTASIGGLSIQSSISRTGAGSIAQEVTVPVAKAGSLTTRTDDNTGVATLSTGHGIVTSDVVDVYWTGGVRYGMAATVATNAVTLDGGAGDNLPAADTAVKLCKQVVLDVDFDGDKLETIAVNSSQAGHAVFEDSADAVLLAQSLSANELWFWASDMGIAIPITGNPVDQVKLSNSSTTLAATVKLAIVYNSDT